MNLKIKVVCSPNTEFAKMLVNNLLDTVKTAHLVKNGIIIEPAQTETGSYLIPEIIDEDTYSLLIDTSEHGGLSDTDNTAQVVCGLSGKPLKAYFIPSKNVVECGVHANFSVPNNCVTIEAKGNDIVITEGRIEHDIEARNANLIKTELYNGHVELIPADLIRFKLAAEVAVDKSNCRNCTHVHYYIDTNQLYIRTRKSI